MFEFAVLTVAGALAGMLNAIAGGGTFLTFPALVYLGVPPIAANATATLAALPGYCGSAYAYRNDMVAEGTLGLAWIVVTAATGSVLGALLLLVTPTDVFSGIVPWLLLTATLLFAFGPAILRRLTRHGVPQAGPTTSALVILAVSIYGGYFNGGLGIMLLAAFGLIGYVNLHGMNGLKNVLSALLSTLSATTFVLAGLIVWQEAFVMAGATLLGGYAGARAARQIERTHLLRLGIVGIGAVMTVLFFLNG